MVLRLVCVWDPVCTWLPCSCVCRDECTGSITVDHPWYAITHIQQQDTGCQLVSFHQRLDAIVQLLCVAQGSINNLPFLVKQ